MKRLGGGTEVRLWGNEMRDRRDCREGPCVEWMNEPIAILGTLFYVYLCTFDFLQIGKTSKTLCRRSGERRMEELLSVPISPVYRWMNANQLLLGNILSACMIVLHEETQRLVLHRCFLSISKPT